MVDEPGLTIVFDSMTKVFTGTTGWRRTQWVNVALREVSFTVHSGESVAVVGESGSGKTTLARLLVGLETPTSGGVSFNGEAASWHPKRNEVRSRARLIQMVFQDPYTSLTPHQSIASALDEVQRVHFRRSRSERKERTRTLLDSVGLGDREAAARPRKLSGGQRQRAAIARALAAEAQLLVLDEAVSALDVSIQAQILNLLADLRQSLRLSYLFITHDLGVVRQVADRVVVLYRGRVVEEGPTAAVLTSPHHPYTRRLLESVPRPHQSLEPRKATSVESTTGCVFRARCPYAWQACEDEPGLLEVGEAHTCRCWLVLQSSRVAATGVSEPAVAPTEDRGP